MQKIFLITLLTLSTDFAFSQCEVKNRLGADDVMYYFVDYVPFYWTSTKELKGGAITDEQNYLLGLKPKPFPEKPAGTKLKDDLRVTLSNDSTYVLKHFDTRYLDYDTSLLFMYVIPEKLLPDFRTYEVVSVKMMMGDEGERVYTFKLHKSAVKDQLDCLIENLKRNKKK
ncbi:MAG: hypothetical protein ACHQD9_04965 [Chitinophagales bacterium]